MTALGCWRQPGLGVVSQVCDLVRRLSLDRNVYEKFVKKLFSEHSVLWEDGVTVTYQDEYDHETQFIVVDDAKVFFRFSPKVVWISVQFPSYDSKFKMNTYIGTDNEFFWDDPDVFEKTKNWLLDIDLKFKSGD